MPRSRHSDGRSTPVAAVLRTGTFVSCSAIAAIEGSQARRLYGDDLPLSVQGPLTGPCGRLERVNPTHSGRSVVRKADAQRAINLRRCPALQRR